MMRQRRFTKEFEEEAVRLVQTSGRTQHEIAGDLGIGCRHWSAGSAGAGIGVGPTRRWRAMVEMFSKTLKSELVWRTIFYTR
jgi:hypothetical protein